MLSNHEHVHLHHRQILRRGLALLVTCVMLTVPTAGFAQDWTYRVRPGDTLWDLTHLYLKPEIDWQSLGKHNTVTNPYALPPGMSLHFPIVWLRVQPAPARIIALHGQVHVQSIGTSTLRPAEDGMLLPIDSTLQTEADSSVTIQFADGSQMQLRENSRVHFDRLARYGETGMVDTRVRLERGRTTNEVIPAKGPASRYIIQTPTGTSSVRGTHFRVGAGDSHQLAATEVVRGVVQVDGQRGERLLHPGQATRLPPGQAPSVDSMLPPPVINDAQSQLKLAPYHLVWQPVPGAQGYRVEAVEAKNLQVLRLARQTTEPRITLGTLPPGDLVLLVRAIAATGVEGQDAQQRVLVPATPHPPLTVRPLQYQSIDISQPRFEWTRNPEAASTVLQLAKEAEFQDLVLERETTNTRLRAPFKLTPGDYFWRVASRDAQGRQGPFGQALSLRISDTPIPAALQAPEIKKGQLTLRWQGGESDQHYHVQMARHPDFSRILLDRVLDHPQVSLPRPRGGTWYVRVQTVEDNGQVAPFLPTQEITLPCRLCYTGAGAGAALLLWLLL